jgi:hypothetical protein
MNKATSKTMKCRFTGSNGFAEYYKCNETQIVLYTGHKERPIVCLSCRSNDCDHTEVVKDHLTEQGVTA